MPRPKDSLTPSANRLLAALPPKAYARLLRHLTPVSLALRHVVESPGRPIQKVYFPTTAVLSMLCTLDGDATVEIGMIGNEGTTAVATCLGLEISPQLTVVQVAGEALMLDATRLKAEFDRGGTLHDLLLRYLSALIAQISQSVGCNTHHLIEARLSRWLLIVQDRVASGEMFLEHEFLSQMLGTGRSAVTIAAGSLRNAGLIRYARGRITVLDRAGLEGSACECYGKVKAAYEAAHLG
jgi:hypothetical protein